MAKIQLHYNQFFFPLIQFPDIINFEIHFYPDKDVTDNDFNPILNTIVNLNVDVYIHRNIFKDEKDFGVPINRIKETVRYIKAIR